MIIMCVLWTPLHLKLLTSYYISYDIRSNNHIILRDISSYFSIPFNEEHQILSAFKREIFISTLHFPIFIFIANSSGNVNGGDFQIPLDT